MKRILEVGCGHGTHAEELTCRGVLLATDVRADAVTAAHRRYPAAHFSVMSAEALAFPDHVFDELHAYDVLEHVDDLERALAEMRRVLRPGGRLVAEVPYLPSEELLLGINADYFRQAHHMRKLSPSEWLSLLNRHGVRVERWAKKRFLENLYLAYWFQRGRRVLNQQGELEPVEEPTQGERLLEMLLHLVLGPAEEARRTRSREDLARLEELMEESLEVVGPKLQVLDALGARLFPKTVRFEGCASEGFSPQALGEIPLDTRGLGDWAGEVDESLRRTIRAQRERIEDHEGRLALSRTEMERMVEDVERQQEVNESQRAALAELTEKVDRLVAQVDERQRANEALMREKEALSRGLERDPWWRFQRWLRERRKRERGPGNARA